MNILHCNEDTSQILASIQAALQTHPQSASYFGDGKSDQKYMEIINETVIWKT